MKSKETTPAMKLATGTIIHGSILVASLTLVVMAAFVTVNNPAEIDAAFLFGLCGALCFLAEVVIITRK